MTIIDISANRATRSSSTCPGWCVRDDHPDDESVHSHVSNQEQIETQSQPLTAHLVQVDGREPLMLIGDRVTTVDQAATLANAVLRLTTMATLAPPGLGFLTTLTGRMSVTTAQMAEAAGIDPARLQEQAVGGQVLTVREFDALALAVVQLLNANANANRRGVGPAARVSTGIC